MWKNFTTSTTVLRLKQFTQLQMRQNLCLFNVGLYNTWNDEITTTKTDWEDWKWLEEKGKMSHNKKVKKENTEVKFVERSNEKKKG